MFGNDQKTIFADLIRSRRERLKISQQELAEKVGLLPKTMAQYELGMDIPEGEILVGLADALYISSAWLMQRLELNHIEIEVLSLLRRLPPIEQARALNILMAGFDDDYESLLDDEDK